MRTFFIGIMSIFFDISTSDNGIHNIFNPQDLTGHYRKEIQGMALDGVYIGAHYSDIRHSIESYKYRSDRQYVGEYVDILAKVITMYSLDESDGSVAIVGVPMHWSRYLIRGFDHINLIVSQLSQKVGVSHKKPLQAFFTRRQSKLSKLKRMKNREYAFGLKIGHELPKIVILIDDIVSTGSTANACAKILKSAGVEKVYGVFIASNQ